jgi:hypothetical protein
VKTKLVRCVFEPDFEVDATVDLHGNVIVCLHRPGAVTRDDENLRPIEAERLAAALLAAAKAARAKVLP